jgi:hypothetical protein
VEVEGMGDDAVQREVLPIPDRQPVGLTTYDARDPDTSFPPIEVKWKAGSTCISEPAEHSYRC